LPVPKILMFFFNQAMELKKAAWLNPKLQCES
jgi:hypothetical protein